MRYKVLLLLAMFIVGCSKQDEKKVFNENDYILNPDKSPSVLGGPQALMVKVRYSQFAMDNKIEGTVVTKLFINENGGLDTFFITNSVHPEVDNAAITAIKLTKYLPGIKNGVPVKSQMIIPLEFSLGDDTVKSETKKSSDTLYTVAPVPVDGLDGIYKRLVNPDGDNNGKIKGYVYVRAFIDEKGNVYKTEVLYGIGKPYIDAALKAVNATKFKPGRKGNTPIKSEVVIPVRF